MRTKEEITQAIERLKLNKGKSKKYNFFGEDNHKQLDEMIYILENDIKEDNSEFEDNYIFDWLNKEFELKELLYPEL